MGLSFLSTAALLSRVSKDGHKRKITVTHSLRGTFSKSISKYLYFLDNWICDIQIRNLLRNRCLSYCFRKFLHVKKEFSSLVSNHKWAIIIVEKIIKIKLTSIGLQSFLKSQIRDFRIFKFRRHKQLLNFSPGCGRVPQLSRKISDPRWMRQKCFLNKNFI